MRNAESGDVMIVCTQFSGADNFFTFPCESSLIHVWKVFNLSERYYCYPVNEIQSKCMLLNRRNYYVATLLLHYWLINCMF